MAAIFGFPALTSLRQRRIENTKPLSAWLTNKWATQIVLA
jgi:hypothetical protein